MELASFKSYSWVFIRLYWVGLGGREGYLISMVGLILWKPLGRAMCWFIIGLDL